jgi:pimeloyl-ACP methyl ester carboxylesterase
VKVVLLHAFPLDERMWAGQREELAGLDVDAPNLYRLGGSVEEWAAAVLARSEGELVAVGASMGGYVALAMARLAPERVRGLLLAGSRAGPDSPERRRQRDEIVATLREHGVAEWLAGSGNPAPPEVVREQTAEDLIRAMEVLRDRGDSTDVVASFAGPFVLVLGENDELLTADEARAIVAVAPRGRLETVEGAGHLVNLDRPERFNAILREFLAQWT